jgi:hypothetical protein
VQEIFDNHYLYLHVAGIISFAALAFRDQLKLRAVLFVSILFAVASHIIGLPQPAWNDLLWNCVTFCINAYILIQLILDRTHLGLNRDQEQLYASLKLLSPGEFRTLLRIAKWNQARGEQVVTTEGETPAFLYYVLEGGVTIDKGGRRFDIPAGVFIGEVAFLHNTPASATVTLEDGARYVSWPVRELERTLQARTALRNTFMRLIGLDAAEKVGRA